MSRGEKGGFAERLLSRLKGCIDRGWEPSANARAALVEPVRKLRTLAECLDPKEGSGAERKERFEQLQQQAKASDDPIEQHRGGVMVRFATGLFLGAEQPDLPDDNMDLERFFRLPKQHARHVHGHRHAGSGLVVQGPMLRPVLDAHQHRASPFEPKDLLPYLHARAPDNQGEATQRRALMSRARSTRRRPKLLEELEADYLNSS